MEATQLVAPPSTPGIRPVQLKDSIEELLQFTLASSIDGTLGIDVGLSKKYCSDLLKEDDPNNSPYPNSSDLSEGIPPYPLYKRLAAALCQSISSGAFCRIIGQMTLIHTDKFPKQKEEEWSKLILERGSDLVQMFKTLDFELNVQEPFFSQLRDGLKTVEGRCAVGDYKRISSGALILVNKCLVLQIQDIHRYASFYEMIEAENISKVLPGVKTTEEGVQIYRRFYSEEKESLNGVLAICVTKLSSQLYNALAAILTGLSYEGVQRLLGFMHTEGTIPGALPPPRSSLLSTFLSPHNVNVKGSTLTDGARSLAKHVNRSSDRFWGTFRGSDSVQNKLAVDVINHLIARCCWLNMHIVPPHGVVFEIRVSEGYGARWSEDGTKFIGFLEPYMEDGHSKGWKH